MINLSTNEDRFGGYEVYPVKSFKFPVGEIQTIVDMTAWYKGDVNFTYVFDGMDSVWELMFAVDSVKRAGRDIGFLKMDYVPFSRQDRVMNKGESFTLKVFCDLINGLGFSEVRVCDPHSDVIPALINNCRVAAQQDIFFPLIREAVVLGEKFYLVSPDGGALKKIYKLDALLRERVGSLEYLGVIECTKRRDVKDGKISGCVAHIPDDFDTKATLVISDDLADGGQSFVHLGKELRKLTKGDAKIILMVTHGFFTKGLDVFDGVIDEIWTKDGKVK